MLNNRAPAAPAGKIKKAVFKRSKTRTKKRVARKRVAKKRGRTMSAKQRKFFGKKKR